MRAIVDGEGAPPVNWLLHTADAEGVYEKLGFRRGPLRYPLMERPRGGGGAPGPSARAPHQ